MRNVYFALVLLAAIITPVHAANKIRVNHKDGLIYVWIPAGSYETGCLEDDKACIGWERKRATVGLKAGFWIGQTEVTQSAYRRMMNADPSYYKGPKLPVERVGWDEATAYCKLVGMRLPTESEWEYAAYGGKEHLPTEPLSAIAWYDPNSDDKTHPVGQKLPNEFGLYDMLGNVWEWVADVNTGPEGRTLKGGSFFNSSRDLRVSNRLDAPADLRHRDIGFRCAVSAW